MHLVAMHIDQRKRCRIMTIASALVHGKARPMQARWPLPNGFHALTGRAASASRLQILRIERIGIGTHTRGIAIAAPHQDGMKCLS